MRIDARYHNGNTRLRALIDNPMQPVRHPAPGANTPEDAAAANVKSLIIRYQQQVVVDARLSAAIARYPYFSFEFAGGNVGEELTVEWVDSDSNQSISKVVIG